MTLLKKIRSKLKSKFVTGSIPYVILKPQNQIIYGQDFGWNTCVPANIKFYIVEEAGDSIWLMADGYGIRANNKYNLNGAYGNGRININVKDMPEELLNYCREQLALQKIKNTLTK